MGLELNVYPGINISQMTGECSKKKFHSLLRQKSVLLVHVETNDVKRLDPGQMVSNLNGLVFQIREANKPRHDKTNKVTVRSAKTQISMGIRPV